MLNKSGLTVFINVLKCFVFNFYRVFNVFLNFEKNFLERFYIYETYYVSLYSLFRTQFEFTNKALRLSITCWWRKFLRFFSFMQHCRIEIYF